MMNGQPRLPVDNNILSSVSSSSYNPTGARKRANGVAVNGTANGNGHASEPETIQQPLKELAQRGPIDWEIPRKVLHGSIGFLTLPLYFLRPPSLTPVVIPLVIGLVIVTVADMIRLRHPGFEKTYEKLLGPLMREVEKTQINGVVWYLIGVIWVLSLYPRDVAVVSILILSWADTSASTFGRLYGHLTPKLPERLRLPFVPISLPLARRKSVAGSFAAFLTGALVAGSFWGWAVEAGGMRPDEAVWNWKIGGWFGWLLLSLGAGLITSVTEALDLGSLDDNMTLPIIGGGGVLVWSFVLRVLLWVF